MQPGGQCPVDAIEYVDDQNVKVTIECYDDDGESKDLLKLAEELNLHIPQNCKLFELKEIVSEHAAFKNVSKLEKLGAKYGVKIIFSPKFHCKTNPIEGFWCHSKQFIRKNTYQTFQALVSLMEEAKENFTERDIHLKLFRRFWRTIKAYSEGKDYLEVLTTFFSGLCKDKILSHRKITNANIDD
ncbi:unnamed protein product [Rotaria magnacalcarata]|uniref:Uncharacterized protein n=1 Tax=Rotaria magnacalcarata TaxID=392030 RepID=A0A816T1P9_9BILA|nr:unnamed protein product [Rotaria magnacalcarata]CAF4318742.1 unnamed protein product [Rotaria magnacalcarata]